MKQCTKCHINKKESEFYKDKYNKDGLTFSCKECRNKVTRQFNIDNPWYIHLDAAKTRCNNENSIRFDLYGGRGIQCFLTQYDVKELWFRDKAYLLKIPSIDRIDNDGDYTFDNCQFIELKDNIIKSNKVSHIKPIIQYDLQMNKIREWKSIAEAAKFLNLKASNISAVCLQKPRYNTTGSYIFRFK